MSVEVTSDTVKYFLKAALETRRYGSTYIHVGKRIGGFNYKNLRIFYTSFGKSLQNGGHKFKAYAWYVEDNKPVPSKEIKKMI